MRLDQWLSQSLNISRSDAKRLIKQKRVSVNQVIQTNTAQQITDNCTVYFDDAPITLPQEQYILLNKPLDYVCSHDDDGYPSALRLLPQQGKKLHFAGRLDAQTTGLVLISSDGQWCHRVSHPNSNKSKSYRVQLEHPLPIEQKKALEQGVLLHSESKKTAPCEIEILANNCCNITLHEGKYHQVRRMFAAIGNHVVSLHRYAIASLNLEQETLALGEFRPLTRIEIESF